MRWIAVAGFVMTAWGTSALAAPPATLAISTDNDLFSPTSTDRDFTAGLAVTYSSRSAPAWGSMASAALTGLDGLLATDLAVKPLAYSLELGAYGFTPEKIEAANIQFDDRPYSSLVYASISHSYQRPESRDGWTTSLTLGALGLNLFEAGQNAIHPIVGSDTAEGWDHQVADGGEPTLRYSAAYHHYLGYAPDSQFKLTGYGSVGYLTEAGIALVFREGLISSPDNRFNPELSTYGECGPALAAGPASESYFWGGLALKARAYNAFLQGQFRDSAHTLATADLHTVLAEAWAGYTYSLTDELKLSYVLRVQSSEIKRGQGDRTLAWGGLVLSRSLR